MTVSLKRKSNLPVFNFQRAELKYKLNHYCPGVSSNKFSWLHDIGFSAL